MQQQSIVFTAPCVAELLNEEFPQPKAGEVVVELACSTISAGTERANLVGDPNVAGRKAPDVSFPRRVGYSSSGVVYRVGEGVTSVKEGDRVFCVWGKHSRYCTVKEQNVYKLDDSISFEEGALIHIATFPLAAIRKCRLELGESAIVMGLGILGLMCVELLRAAGATPIIAVDPIESKRAQALELGADYALDPFDPSFVKQVKTLTGKGADVAIEVTGKGQGLDMVLDCMKNFGRVALLGCTRNSDFTIDYYRKVHCPGITLIGAHTMARPKQDSSGGWWTEADDERTVHRLLATKRLNLLCLL
ncbi:MAG: zinc-binding alcohol dehydrogenase, partial [Clostridia bacterium]|nr:zinc-binding alcohol dehydrogenase [Clostridia bacterium]